MIMLLKDVMYATRLEMTKKWVSNMLCQQGTCVDNLLECITIEIMISGHKNVIVSCL